MAKISEYELGELNLQCDRLGHETKSSYNFKSKVSRRGGIVTMVSGIGHQLTQVLGQLRKNNPLVQFYFRGYEHVEFVFGSGLKDEPIKCWNLGEVKAKATYVSLNETRPITTSLVHKLYGSGRTVTMISGIGRRVTQEIGKLSEYNPLLQLDFMDYELVEFVFGSSWKNEPSKLCGRDGNLIMFTGKGCPLSQELNQLGTDTHLMQFDCRGYESVEFVFGSGCEAESIVVCKTNTRGTCFRCAGPHHEVYVDSDEVHACISTCGGLCPGLSSEVRKILCALCHMHGVTKAVGIDMKCFNYGELTKKNMYVRLNDSVSDPKGTTHLVLKFKFCGKGEYITMISAKSRPLTEELSQQGEYTPLMWFDCKSFEHEEFLLGSGWHTESLFGKKGFVNMINGKSHPLTEVVEVMVGLLMVGSGSKTETDGRGGTCHASTNSNVGRSYGSVQLGTGPVQQESGYSSKGFSDIKLRNVSVDSSQKNPRLNNPLLVVKDLDQRYFEIFNPIDLTTQYQDSNEAGFEILYHDSAGWLLLSDLALENFHFLHIRTLERVDLPSIQGWDNLPFQHTLGAFRGTPGSAVCRTVFVCSEIYGVKVLHHNMDYGWSRYDIILEDWVLSDIGAMVLHENRMYLVNKNIARIYVISLLGGEISSEYGNIDNYYLNVDDSDEENGVDSDEEDEEDNEEMAEENQEENEGNDNPLAPESMFFVEKIDGLLFVFFGPDGGPTVNEIYPNGTSDEIHNWMGTIYGINSRTGTLFRGHNLLEEIEEWDELEGMEDMEGARIVMAGGTWGGSSGNVECIEYIPAAIQTRLLKSCRAGDNCTCSFAFIN